MIVHGCEVFVLFCFVLVFSSQSVLKHFLEKNNIFLYMYNIAVINEHRHNTLGQGITRILPAHPGEFGYVKQGSERYCQKSR